MKQLDNGLTNTIQKTIIIQFSLVYKHNLNDIYTIINRGGVCPPHKILNYE